MKIPTIRRMVLEMVALGFAIFAYCAAIALIALFVL